MDTGKVNIHGKEYSTVALRVKEFRKKYEFKYSIVTELVERDAETVVMKASILEGEFTVATGYAEEKRNSTMINKTSALENCETSAIGRALAAFGMAGTEYASADEVANAISNQTKTVSEVKGLNATHKQIGTILSLVKKEDSTKEEALELANEKAGKDVTTLTLKEASALIKELMS